MLEHLPAAEREELLGERGRALGGLEHLLDVLPQRLVGAQRSQHELPVARDRRKQVVEVVRDAARKPADGLHLLRLDQLLLRAPQLRHVFRDSHRAHHLARRVPHGRHPAPDPADGPVRADHPKEFAARLGTPDGRENLRQQALAVLGVDRFEPVAALGVSMLAAAPEHFFVRGAQIQSLAGLGVGHEEDLPHVVGQFAEPLFALPQRLFRLPSFRHIEPGAEHFARLARSVEEEPGVVLHPRVAPVLAPEPVFGCEAAIGQEPADLALDPRPVLRVKVIDPPGRCRRFPRLVSDHAEDVVAHPRRGEALRSNGGGVEDRRSRREHLLQPRLSGH